MRSRRQAAAAFRRIEAQHLWCVDIPSWQCRRQLLVVGAGRYEPAAAEAGHHRKLREDVLAAMLRRQVAPESEAAARAQLGAVVKHAAADPRDAIDALVRGGEAKALRDVVQVGRAVQPMPLPLRRT